MRNSMTATVYKTASGTLCIWGLERMLHPDCFRCPRCHMIYPTQAVMMLATGAQTHVYCCTPDGNPPPGAIYLKAALISESAGWPASDEPPAEREEKPKVCRWCKGAGRITVNFKTKRCEECAPKDEPESQ